jgi:hypothetical protein
MVIILFNRFLNFKFFPLIMLLVVDFFCGNLPTGRQVCEKKKKEISRRGALIKSQRRVEYDYQNSPGNFKKVKKAFY